MFSKTEIELAVETALSSEERLRMTLLAEQAAAVARTRNVVRFAELVEHEMKQRLGRCQIESLRGTTIWGGIMVRDQEWPEGYKIGIQAEGACNFIGVSKDESLPALSGVKNILDECLGRGRSNQWWVWWRYLEPPFHDWKSPETLFELYLDPDRYVKHLAEEITRLAQALTEYWVNVSSSS